MDQSRIVDSFVEAAKNNEHQILLPDQIRRHEKSSEFKAIYDQLKASK